MGSQNCVLYNRLGNTRQTTNSEIGSNFAENGSLSYANVEHEGGVDVGNNVANFIDTPDLSNLTTQQGTIEFWWKPSYGSADGADGGRSGFAEIGDNIQGAGEANIFINRPGVGVPLQFNYKVGIADIITIRATAITWNAGEIHHLAFTWDEADAAQRGHIFFDGVDVTNVILNNISIAGAVWGAASPNITIGLIGADKGKAIFDNVKLWNIALSSFEDRFIEGFGARAAGLIYPTPDFVPPTPTPVLFEPIRSKVEVIGGLDIFAMGLVDNIGNVTESRSLRKDKLIDNEIRIPVDNKSLAFSPENTASIYNGTNWYFSPVKIWDEDNILIWDGLLWDIIRKSQGRTAQLISRSIMSKIKNIKVVYESADWETGPGALINIFAAADPPITEYNNKTFQDSAAVLTTAGAFLKLKIDAADNTSMQNIIEKVAEYCAADAYSHLGEIRFKVWQKITGTGSIAIGGSDIIKQPVTRSAMNEVINDYSIGYSGDEGAPAIDSANGNVGSISRSKYGTRALPELSTGDENQIVFKDINTAVWIGEQYIRRTHRNIDSIPLPLIMSSLSVKGRLRNFLDLETIISYTYSDEGFDNETYEVFKFVRNNDKNIVGLILFSAAS